jgi:HemY protein
MEGQKYAAALEQITQLDEKSKSHPSVIRYHAQVLVELTKWDVLREQLKGWKKTLSAEEYTQLLSQSLQGEFTEVASKQGLQGLKQHWKSQKRNVRNDVTWQRIYIEQLMQMDHHDDAAAELLALQKKGPNDVLVPLFGQLKVSQPAQVKKCLESWIKASPESQSLYSILGGFAYHSKDWDLANKALSKAVDLSPTIGDFTVLAKVKERMQDQAGALYCYKSALQLKNT